jgi:DNA invertase Pin-like site-specific DNA recombinase
VSTDEQSLALQVDALNRAGCMRIWEEKASGALQNRPQLAALMQWARPGDTLVVWKLDRWGRSLKDLVLKLDELRERGIGFRSLTEGIDTTTALGEAMFYIAGVFAQFERGLTIERTKAGMDAARAKGRLIGRPRKVTPEQVEAMRRYRDEGRTPTWIAKAVGVSRPAVYHYLGDGARAG